ncbi:MAG TPA: pyridoxamine 5'-phosphate oxidase family protein [Gammaproteobacteria bacterium]
MKPAELDRIPAEMWQALAARHGAWRTPVLASVTPEGSADARVVVLREVSAQRRELVFFTDRRSRKHDALLANPSACFVIYDAGAGWQVRLYGSARAETANAETDAWWEMLGEHQRAHYGNAGDDSEERNTQEGRENFAAFRVTIDRFHCLWLHDDGNEAAEFLWRDNGWRGHFVRP